MVRPPKLYQQLERPLRRTCGKDGRRRILDGRRLGAEFEVADDGVAARTGLVV